MMRLISFGLLASFCIAVAGEKVPVEDRYTLFLDTILRADTPKALALFTELMDHPPQVLDSIEAKGDLHTLVRGAFEKMPREMKAAVVRGETDAAGAAIHAASIENNRFRMLEIARRYAHLPEGGKAYQWLGKYFLSRAAFFSASLMFDRALEAPSGSAAATTLLELNAHVAAARAGRPDRYRALAASLAKRENLDAVLKEQKFSTDAETLLNTVKGSLVSTPVLTRNDVSWLVHLGKDGAAILDRVPDSELRRYLATGIDKRQKEAVEKLMENRSTLVDIEKLACHKIKEHIHAIRARDDGAFELMGNARKHYVLDVAKATPLNIDLVDLFLTTKSGWVITQDYGRRRDPHLTLTAPDKRQYSLKGYIAGASPDRSLIFMVSHDPEVSNPVRLSLLRIKGDKSEVVWSEERTISKSLFFSVAAGRGLPAIIDPVTESVLIRDILGKHEVHSRQGVKEVTGEASKTSSEQGIDGKGGFLCSIRGEQKDALCRIDALTGKSEIVRHGPRIDGSYLNGGQDFVNHEDADQGNYFLTLRRAGRGPARLLRTRTAAVWNGDRFGTFIGDEFCIFNVREGRTQTLDLPPYGRSTLVKEH